jgi:hypothetical protein
MKNYIKKLWDFNIFTQVIKVEGEIKNRKIFRGCKSITEEIIQDLDNFDLDKFNFLAIDLRKSGLICLDIEGHPDSVNDFYSFLEKNNVKKDDLLIEKTINNGLHIYFRNNYNLYKESHWNNLGNIHFDLLTRRSFTTPSFFKNKKYEWIGDNFNKIKSKNDISNTPIFVLDLLKIETKYYKQKKGDF